MIQPLRISDTYNIQNNKFSKPAAKKHFSNEKTSSPLNMPYYLYPFISFKGQSESEKYSQVNLNIPNLHRLNNNGLRGESLANKRNHKFIFPLHKKGIRHIIDIKTSDFSKSYENRVKAAGMSYHHFPIDAEKTSNREIINCLPDLFKVLNDGDFYISCAQGLHRTDIALAVNYIFNKDASDEPPVLYGHKTKNGLRYSDIFRRTNSIFNELTYQDRVKLGLTDFTPEKYKEKKQKLIEFNS